MFKFGYIIRFRSNFKANYCTWQILVKKSDFTPKEDTRLYWRLLMPVKYDLIEGENILKAKELLYLTYVVKLGWQPEIDNPSGYRIENKNGRLVIEDNFESVSRWFGAFENNSLIGCIRLIYPLDNRLEFQFYVSSDISKWKFPAEINRFAVHSNYINSFVPINLIGIAAKYAKNNNRDVLFTAVPKDEPFNLCIKLGFQNMHNTEFKYAVGDIKPVWLLSADQKNDCAIDRIIVSCSKNDV